MMRSSSLSDDRVRYESLVTHTSKLYPSVRFTVHRMSFSRRCDLAQRVRELNGRMEFHEAGESVRDKIEAAILSTEISSLYLSWGLVTIDGFEIDGLPATPEGMISAGPEDLCNEIVGAIQSECGLSQEERKN